jgi:hypothetical protein
VIGADLKYVHQLLNEEIRSIGGYYKVFEEGVLDYEGRKVLYLVKGAHVETSCCGSGGVAYMDIPGYVTSWKSAKYENGLDISEVKRIRDSSVQKKVRKILAERYPYISVIDFD